LKRELHRLTDAPFDVLVVGGGILGACVAWDAALRGLDVGLVERGDFASGTSSNSLKIVHGGLRYIQSLDLRRMRESIRERSTWLRIAAHLVEPLPVLVPAFRRRIQSRLPLILASAITDTVGRDRNSGLHSDRRLPPGRLLSRRETLDLVPQLDRRDLTGSLLFYDAQMYNSERLVLEVLQAASEAGAVVANYVELESGTPSDGSHWLTQARDVMTGQSLQIRARLIVNAAGPATPAFAASLTGRPAAAKTNYSVALNVMVRSLGHRVAFAMPARREPAEARGKFGSRQLFVVPRRGRSVIGTGHFIYSGDCVHFELDEQYISRFLSEVNAAWPGNPFRREDLTFAHGGLLPVTAGARGSEVRLLKRHRIIDHAADGAPSLISAISVKYTTARLVAEAVLNLVCRKLGKRRAPCTTAFSRLPGAPAVPVKELIAQARQRHGGLLDVDILEHLVRTYGTRYEHILTYRDSTPDWDQRLSASSPVIKAQMIHAVREEMAVRAEDLVYRRTELGARGDASDDNLQQASAIISGRVS
jgi:glycerol-3-phosphate dehydrogenase